MAATRSVPMLDLDDKVDAASSIYQDALGLLTAMSHRKEVASNPTEKTLLHKSVGRLYLWGEDFADGKLRRVMMHSWDLANTILRLLVALAKALLKKHRSLGLSPVVLCVNSLTYQLQDLDDNMGNSDDDSDNQDSDHISDNSDVEDYGDDITFYLDLLMNLVPSMEQVYSQAIKEEETARPRVQQPKPAKVVKRKSQSYARTPGLESVAIFGDEWCRNLCERFERIMRQRLKKAKERLPKIPIAPVEPAAIRFQSLLNGLSQTPLKYEDPGLLDDAVSLVPLDVIYGEAEDQFLLEQAKAASAGSDLRSRWGYQDCVIRALSRWFKTQFFCFVNNPLCPRYSGPTVSIGTGPPNDIEATQGVSRVELYQCSVSDSCEVVRFPRISNVRALLTTRRGRVGEWVNCFSLFCRAVGTRTRWVWCAEDHVWTEVYSEHARRWVHVDPCEDAWDAPRMYTEGWGKKLSYCIAFSVDGATDVTRRYIRDFTKYGKSRNRASEEALIYIIQDIRAKRRDWLNQEAKEQLRQEDMMEESELQMYIVRRITRDVIGHPGSMTDSLPSKSDSPEQLRLEAQNELEHSTSHGGL